MCTWPLSIECNNILQCSCSTTKKTAKIITEKLIKLKKWIQSLKRNLYFDVTWSTKYARIYMKMHFVCKHCLLNSGIVKCFVLWYLIHWSVKYNTEFHVARLPRQKLQFELAASAKQNKTDIQTVRLASSNYLCWVRWHSNFKDKIKCLV